MEPIVDRLKKDYRSCFTLERVNFHDRTPWHDLLFPLASPEFALLDSSNQILYRWFGYTEREGFDEILEPICR